MFELITPEEYLRRHPVNQVATPAASSWGEEGYWRVWLNEKTEWIYPHLQLAQERMTGLARLFPQAEGLPLRALQQAGRELLLAQASDWPFIIRTGTSPDYARRRVTDHLLRFTKIYDQILASQLDESSLAEIESRDNIFPEIDYHYWS
jgi:1,4-alpha-glucan branching enzyme